MRSAVVVALVVVVITPLPGGAAGRRTAHACPVDAPDAFVDDEASVHEANIDCIAYWGITKGVTASEYSPGSGTRRDQMATFVGNFMTVAGFGLSANPADAFTDDETSVHELNVNRLAAAAVVAGVGGAQYAPAALVRRDQMATYVVNAIEAVLRTPLPVSVDTFIDDVGNAHEDNIDKLAGIGVVVGKTATTYDPGSFVRRDQMASFLAKAADYLAEAGHWPMFGTNETFRVVPRWAATLAVGQTRSYTAYVGDAEAIGVGIVYCDDVAVGSTVSFATYALGGYEGSPQPVDGVIEFEVTGTVAGECERPVVISDLDGDGQLDLDSGGRPTEPFGVGGAVTWTSSGGGGGGTPTGPTITDVRAHDLGTTGVVDADDVHQFIFSERVATTVDDPGSMYRLDGAMDVTFGTNANAVLMPGGTYNGTVYPDNQVMRVYITGAPSAAAVGGGGVSYPTTITEISTSWGIDLASSADKVIEADYPPDMISATASAATDVVTVQYVEDVVCDSTAASQFRYSDGNTAATTPTSVTCTGSTLTLGFSGDIVNGSEVGFGSVTYTDDNSEGDSNDVRDSYGNQAQSPETQGVLLQA